MLNGLLEKIWINWWRRKNSLYLFCSFSAKSTPPPWPPWCFLLSPFFEFSVHKSTVLRSFSPPPSNQISICLLLCVDREENTDRDQVWLVKLHFKYATNLIASRHSPLTFQPYYYIPLKPFHINIYIYIYMHRCKYVLCLPTCYYLNLFFVYIVV